MELSLSMVGSIAQDVLNDVVYSREWQFKVDCLVYKGTKMLVQQKMVPACITALEMASVASVQTKSEKSTSGALCAYMPSISHEQN